MALATTSSGQQLRIQLQLRLDKALLPSLFVGFVLFSLELWLHDSCEVQFIFFL